VTDISITVINVLGILFICVCLMQRLTTAPLDNHLTENHMKRTTTGTVSDQIITLVIHFYYN